MAAAPKPPLGTVIETEDGRHSIWNGKDWAPARQNGDTWAVDNAAMQQMGLGAGAGSDGVMQDTKTDQAALAKLRETSQGSLNTSQAYGRFVDLNRKQATGPILGMPILPLPKFLGQAPSLGDTFLGPLSDPYNEMKSITAATGPGLRPPGSGSSSDKDTQLYLSGGPQVTYGGKTNQNIYERQRERSDMDAARTAFNETWFSKRGNLLGADQAFNAFWSKRKAGDEQANRTGSFAPNLPKLPPTGTSRTKTFTYNPQTGEIE